MDFFVYDGQKGQSDDPVIVRTGDAEHEFKVEIGFQELEVVAYSGDLKIIGYAHFGRAAAPPRGARPTTCATSPTTA